MEAVATFQRTQKYFNNVPEKEISYGRMDEPKGYTIAPITVEDSDQVLDFLRTYFFLDEPLNICVGLLDEPGSRCEDLEQYCLGSIPDGVSIKAVDGNGEILGVAINSILRKNGPKPDVEGVKNQKYKKIVNLLATISKESDFFGQFPEVDQCLDICVVSVSEACRGRGIAKALFDQCKTVAKENQLPMIRVDCTSHFSAMAVARLGYSVIYQLNYSDHLDDEGKPVFVPPPPHSCAKTCVLRVS